MSSNKPNLSKDGSFIDFKQSENVPTTAKKFRQSPEIQGFYSFVYDNGLQQEAFDILTQILLRRRAERNTKAPAAEAGPATVAAPATAKAAKGAGKKVAAPAIKATAKPAAKAATAKSAAKAAKPAKTASAKKAAKPAAKAKGKKAKK